MLLCCVLSILAFIAQVFLDDDVMKLDQSLISLLIFTYNTSEN